jgi:hypothetical protein
MQDMKPKIRKNLDGLFCAKQGLNHASLCKTQFLFAEVKLYT